MTPIAPHLACFLREHLPLERKLSDQTCETYAYTYQLLINFAATRFNTQPSQLHLEQIDASLVTAFLLYLESDRRNCPRTCNNRLAAIKSFLRFLEYRLPGCLDQARCIRAIAPKKTDTKVLDYLTRSEMQALLDTPDTRTEFGIRDRAMLLLAFAAGLRVSELVGLPSDQITFGSQPAVRIMGKGRRERILPLWKETVTVLREWLGVRRASDFSECFLNTRNEPITRSGFEYILAKHVKKAALVMPSITAKKSHRIRCIVMRYHLSAMTRKELPEYLTHRLRIARCELPLFEPPAFEAIFQATQALPRKVNRLAHHALTAAAIGQAKTISVEHGQAALTEIGS